MSFTDKIEQTGKNRSIADQEVRDINLPVDARKGENIFSDTHDQASSQEVSSHLQKKTKNF